MTAAVGGGRPADLAAAPRSHGTSIPNGGGEKVFEHITDLQRKARSGYNPHGSIGHLLDAATRGLAQAQTLLDFRRPDLSYIEYLRVSEIVVVDIPRNKEWPQFQVDHGGGKALQEYRVLQRRVNALNEQYANIKQIIVNNNKRSGVQPAGANGVNGHTRAESAPQNSVNGYAANGHATAQKIRPTPSPKPEALHGRAVSTATAGMGAMPPPGTDLSARFAKLRTHDVRPESRGSNASSVHGSPVSLARSDDFDGRASFDSLSRISSNSSSRPQGPRGMPPSGSGPPLPGKLPLNTNFAATMPKEPSPTYSPARNMQTTGNIAPPRHSARSMVPSSTRRQSGAPSSSASAHAPNGAYSSNDYFPSAPARPSNAPPPAHPPRRRSVNVPLETRISNERLYDYLERFNVLLIDFRSREEFDQGHIYARSVICIDPLSLQQGMSAEQLLERMVLSPEDEQQTFMHRNEFDLVVYYDNDTQSESYLSRPQTERQAKLKYLHEALHDFNQDKPLPRPPIMLIGGLAAWVDLVGNQALMMSNTAARVKQGRPLQRRPAAGGNGVSQLRMPKRRLRDYNPMDADEEKQWRERARAESVVLPTPTTMTTDGELVEEPEGDDGDDSGSAIKEFLERFPEAGSLDRHAFGPLQPSRAAPAPPEVPAKVPAYPSAPPPSQYPTVPTRPPPAAPRMSYTGVSDRAASQNAPPTRSSSLVPYIPPKYLATNLRLPKTGLHNFGATCYMNSMIQALSATTPLSILFLDDSYRGLIQQDNWKGSKSRLLPEFYSNLIRSLWKGDVTFIKPTTFRKYCGTLSDTFAGNDQQDAKEFFDVIVDALHEDLNLNWRKPPLKELSTDEEAHRERMPKHLVAKLEWARYTHREHSFITNLFAGQHYSQLRFTPCGHTSTKYEAFYSISVEIPRPRDPRAARSGPTLDDCLRSYCSEELLSGEDQVKCEVCGEFRDAVKQLTITRAPQFLVVHFKRFGYSRSAQKLHVPVHFPLANLDLTPYVLPPPSAADARYIETHFPAYAAPEPTMAPPYAYDAYAVVRHHGRTLESGHYTSYVKDRARGVWRYFNDTHSGDFQPGQGRFAGEGDLRNGEAYVVFYSRVGNGAGGGGGGGHTQQQQQPPPTPGPGGVGKF